MNRYIWHSKIRRTLCSVQTALWHSLTACSSILSHRYFTTCQHAHGMLNTRHDFLYFLYRHGYLRKLLLSLSLSLSLPYICHGHCNCHCHCQTYSRILPFPRISFFNTLQDCGHLSIVHSAFQVSAGIAKYGIHLGQHQFNRFFAQNGSIRELAKEETSGFNTPRRDRLACSSCKRNNGSCWARNCNALIGLHRRPL